MDPMGLYSNTTRYLFTYFVDFYTHDTVMFGIGILFRGFLEHGSSEDHFPIGFKSEFLVQACSERPEARCETEIEIMGFQLPKAPIKSSDKTDKLLTLTILTPPIETPDPHHDTQNRWQLDTPSDIPSCKWWDFIPKSSMYGIFTYIWLVFNGQVW